MDDSRTRKARSPDDLSKPRGPVARIAWTAIVWIGRHELVVLAGLFAIVAGTWMFIELAEVATRGSAPAFDDWLLRILRQPENPAMPRGPAWIAEAMRDFTALGGAAVLALMTAAVAGFLLLERKLAALAFVVMATGAGFLAGALLKMAYDRPRPAIVPYLADVHSSSFPSGHSMMSAVVYLTLGTLLTRLVAAPRLKFYFLSVAVVLSGLVGISRVYLGVHYPTDVLAGWCAGLVWATLCWLIAHKLQQRGAIEKQI